MRITEIAPPGREKQVKALKKKFDDKGAPYAIAWAQHNKHGKPKKKESVDPLRSDMDAKKELAQEIYNNNKEYQQMYPTWKEFMNSEDFDFENERLLSKFEGKMSDKKDMKKEGMASWGMATRIIPQDSDLAPLFFWDAYENMEQVIDHLMYKAAIKNVDQNLLSQLQDELPKGWHSRVVWEFVATSN